MPIKIYELSEMGDKARQDILARGKSEIEGITPKVKEIAENVRKRGDAALLECMKAFDGIELSPETMKVSKEEIGEAYEKISPPLVNSMKTLAANVKRFHSMQKPKEMWVAEVSLGLLAGQIAIPLDIVGCYAPGGRGRFPSTVLMTVIPAKCAGVDRVILCTPPDKFGKIPPGVLVAADISGADEIFKLSGAQAIAAMAYGTGTVPKVRKIAGPGGAWVVAAKQLLRNEVEIDVPAGPGEGMILADETANARFAAADVLIQAEHGNDSTGVLITTSRKLALAVQKEVGKQIGGLPELRKNFVKTSLAKYGAIIVAKTIDDAISFVNEYAPEHLEIMAREPLEIMKKIRNAGAFYLGDYAPLSAGCFCSGPNHTLPTGGQAKAFGGLKTEDFMKKVTFEFPSKSGLENLKGAMLALADYEGFPAHGNAIRIRFER